MTFPIKMGGKRKPASELDNRESEGHVRNETHFIVGGESAILSHRPVVF
jgi:hypothetical protein